MRSINLYSFLGKSNSVTPSCVAKAQISVTNITIAQIPPMIQQTLDICSQLSVKPIIVKLSCNIIVQYPLQIKI